MVIAGGAAADEPPLSITLIKRDSVRAAACLRSHASRSAVYSACCALPASSTHVNCQLDPLITRRCRRRIALQLNRQSTAAAAAAATSRPATCSFSGASASLKMSHAFAEILLALVYRVTFDYC